MNKRFHYIVFSCILQELQNKGKNTAVRCNFGAVLHKKVDVKLSIKKPKINHASRWILITSSLVISTLKGVLIYAVPQFNKTMKLYLMAWLDQQKHTTVYQTFIQISHNPNS